MDKQGVKVAFVSRFNSYIMSITITTLDTFYIVDLYRQEIPFERNEDIHRDSIRNLPNEEFDAIFFEQRVDNG